MAEIDVDVLIAGFGPTGATLAALLGAHGIRAMVVEPAASLFPLPRAVHFDDEIMALFARLGIADRVLEHAAPASGYEFRTGDGELLLRFSNGARDTPSGWQSSYMFWQPGLEAVLRAKVAELPSVSVQLSWRLVEFEQQHDRVVAVIAESAGATQTVAARFLVGADGASSIVRDALGVSQHDYGFDEPWLVIDALVDDPARVPDTNLQICDPRRPTTCVRISDRRHRWEFMLLPGEEPAAMTMPEQIKALLAPWMVDGTIRLERAAVYRFHGLVARDWRVGQTFLAGDAAHQMPPFAGQGMCSGLRDVDNLAWKLAAVVRDGADPALLDTYQSEREPHVRTYIELAIGMGQIICTRDNQVAAQRDAAMLAQRAAGIEPLSPPEPAPLGGMVIADDPEAGRRFPAFGLSAVLEQKLGMGAWLLGGLSYRPDIAAIGLDHPVLAGRANELATWLSARNAEAVLVRPDRYIFGIGDAATLAQAWQSRLATPVVVT